MVTKEPVCEVCGRKDDLEKCNDCGDLFCGFHLGRHDCPNQEDNEYR